jgi:multiple sugar transport system ATP-binding protein
MRSQIARIQHELGVTTIYVTHDQVEAMTMADRVAVVDHGVLQQVDSPERLYAEPANLFVAAFMGSPSMNLLEGQVEAREAELGCRIGDYVLPLSQAVIAGHPALTKAVGHKVTVGVRPEGIDVTAPDGSGLPGTVVVAEALGFEVLAHITVDATAVTQSHVLEEETEALSKGTTLVARLAGDARLKVGDRVRMTLDPAKLHFFDLADGRSFR